MMNDEITELIELLRNYLEDLEIRVDGTWMEPTREGDRVRRAIAQLETRRDAQ